MTDLKCFFGETVKFYRNRIGLSQEKFALKINIDRTYLASVEKGKRNISIENIHKIIRGLNISFSDFFQKMEELEVTNGNKGIKKKG